MYTCKVNHFSLKSKLLKTRLNAFIDGLSNIFST